MCLASIYAIGFVSPRERISDLYVTSNHRRSFTEYDPSRYSHNVVKDNHKPVFTDCSRYNPTVKEEEPRDTSVITISAIDEDPPEAGGTLTYSFVLKDGERGKFNINNETGEITTSHIFDRDEPSRNKEVYVTVQATDNGRPTLADVCTFKITITDINDNSPIFDKTNYYESVPQDMPVNREVMRISATDIDDGTNSVVTYSFDYGSTEKYFRIDEETGVIYLNNSLIPDVPVGRTFRIQATARDNGRPPNSVSTELEIKVVDSNKKAPTFVEFPREPIELKEDFRDYEKTIATITAKSNMENEELLFFLETGRTEQTNKLNNFVLRTFNETAEIKLGRDLDYESNTEYTLQIRVQNKDLLSAVTKIVIKVQDVNDNIPAFLEFVAGNVLENEEPGTPVMQVQAVDLDGTTDNNIVSYELADHQDLFQIDPRTGNITTKDKFDRETNNIYNVKVVAKDNSPSALKRTGEPNSVEQVFRIVIEDKNDNRPKFTKSVYVAENILESTDIHKVVIEVKAEDKDTASVIKYYIISGNIDEAFSIEEITGKIRVKNELDYEQRTFYELEVLADDGKFNDTALVKINIENVNDMLPVFIDFPKEIYIKEETLVPDCLVKVKAYDPDIADRNASQNIIYKAKYVAEGDQYLSVDKDGCIRLTKTLDRDPPNGSVEWQVFVSATDENNGPLSQTTTESFFIRLIDINDNAPFLNISEVVWYENKPLLDHEFITILTAEDYDNETINGPPFKYRLAENSTKEIVDSFQIKGDRLLPNKVFDREQKKFYLVYIAITDSGNPPLTGVSVLKVIIGDVNDNPMNPGSSEIFVNSIGPAMPPTVIGRVYVDDPDDWDLHDKQFYWEQDNRHPQFELNRNTGHITMLVNTEASRYDLTFRVLEHSTYFDSHEVIAAVTVVVKEIPRIAVVRSGSLRLHGTDEQDFITSSEGVSPKTKLHKQLSTIVNVSLDNLDILTIAHSPFHKNEKVLDLRYSAHGSPYYFPEKLNTLTTLRQEELDALIQMSNIAECMYEDVCPNLSCTNYLNISDVPIVVNTNRTSYVSISATVEPKCTCDVYEPPECLNNGVLIENAICNCAEGFEGPHCEAISIGFLGAGFALYSSFQTCNHSEITLEITTIQENGLIFYIGPIRNNPLLPVKDFMSLELKGGYPYLLLDYGSGTVQVEQKYKKINDGKSHFIYIMFQQHSVELKVDNCAMSNCLQYGAIPGPNKALNVNGPLQVGGTVMDVRELASQMSWQHTPTGQGFSGCVRNFTYNGKTYDLGNPGYSKNVNFNCNGFQASAATFGIDSNFLVALLVCLAILLILLLAVVVHRRKQDGGNDKDMDDIRENIINYEDEGGGEVDTGFDLNVLRRENYFDDPLTLKQKEGLYGNAAEPVPDISGFLLDKKDTCDKDPDCNPFDDVRYYAYEGDGNTSRSSLSSLASCTDEGDLKFNYLSNFGPRFRKLADMYGEEPSDDDDQDGGEESWC